MKPILSLLLFVSCLSFGQTAKPITAQQAFNLSDQQVAIEGYDPVAYFKKNKAVKGQAEITTIYQGVTYHFVSADNKNMFIANPQQYQPQYGGWCAYAMGSSGEKVEVDPETFKIVNGKLYLFYNSFFNNTLKTWNKDEAGLMKKADANWPKFYH